MFEIPPEHCIYHTIMGTHVHYQGTVSLCILYDYPMEKEERVSYSSRRTKFTDPLAY